MKKTRVILTGVLQSGEAREERANGVKFSLASHGVRHQNAGDFSYPLDNYSGGEK